MARLTVDGCLCEVEFRRENRYATLDLHSPIGKCFSGGEHIKTITHPHGSHQALLAEMKVAIDGEQVVECECEDCINDR